MGRKARIMDHQGAKQAPKQVKSHQNRSQIRFLMSKIIFESKKFYDFFHPRDPPKMAKSGTPVRPVALPKPGFPHQIMIWKELKGQFCRVFCTCCRNSAAYFVHAQKMLYFT